MNDFQSFWECYLIISKTEYLITFPVSLKASINTFVKLQMLNSGCCFCFPCRFMVHSRAPRKVLVTIGQATKVLHIAHLINTQNSNEGCKKHETFNILISAHRPTSMIPFLLSTTSAKILISCSLLQKANSTIFLYNSRYVWLLGSNFRYWWIT